jgi:hypothetical protein
MKIIPLTQGKFATVDDDMYEYLNQWKWHVNRGRNTWYACRGDGWRRKVLSMHRVIMNTPDGVLVDHINGDGLDNRKANLRNCTNTENQRNSNKQINNSSGYKGVYLDKRRDKYFAQITVNNKALHSGYFRTAKEAARAYDEMAKKHFGEFARLNSPDA